MPKKSLIEVKETRLNNKGINELFAKNNKGFDVDIGLFQNHDAPKLDYDRRSQNATLIEVAKIHEFGDSNIPQRSFIRGPFDANSGYIKLVNSVINRLVKNDLVVESAKKIIGSGILKSITKTIKDIILPLNESATIKRKGTTTGSDVPLIATGQLINSLAYRSKNT